MSDRPQAVVSTGQGPSDPVSAFDVAAKILELLGPMTTMKLQKLVYYAQAWALVWDEEPLFGDRIEAWANGPVVVDLYKWHSGRFKVADCSKGDPANLNAAQVATVQAVCDYYGDRSSQELSDLTHRELPWLSARKGLDAGQRGRREISHAVLAEYYGGL